MEQNIYSPFLRWAGGKTWLARQFSEVFSDIDFNAYHEPFLGSGAVFFKLNPDTAFLSDSNAALIDTYIQVRDDVEAVIQHLSAFENSEARYYEIRSSTFDAPSQAAAQFIYLNKTSFNGIYRVNLRGQYNVPYGGEGKNHFEPDTLRRASQALENVHLSSGDFEKSLLRVKAGDLVFLDPPYTVSHNKNGFIKYNQKLFSIDDQKRLAQYIEAVLQKGARFILSNADHEAVRDIFKDVGDMRSLSRQSLLGGTKAKRGRTDEIIVTNVWKGDQ